MITNKTLRCTVCGLARRADRRGSPCRTSEHTVEEQRIAAISKERDLLTVICKRCGCANVNGARFCERCSKRLPAPPARTENGAQR